MTATNQPNPASANPAAEPPKSQGGLWRLVMTSRRQFGVFGVVIGAVLLMLAVYLISQGFSSTATKTVEDVKDKIAQPTAPEAKTETAFRDFVNDADTRFYFSGLGLLLIGTVIGLAGLYLLIQPQRAGQEEIESRIWVTVTFFGVGLSLSLLAFVLLSDSRPSLERWINRDENDQGKPTLISLFVLFLGLGLLFVGLGPVQSEIRKSSAIRRLCFGYNAVFNGLLLLTLLVTFNVILSVRTAQQLNVTQASFIELKTTSKNALDRLEVPVKAYLIMPPEHVMGVGNPQRPSRYEGLFGDCLALLRACSQTTSKFTYEVLSPLRDDERIRELHETYNFTKADRENFGILLVVDTQPKPRHVFLVDQDLVVSDGRAGLFNGESKLIIETLFLEGAGEKSIVYVTQGSGELSITEKPSRNRPDGRTASDFVELLKELKLDVRPLTLENMREADLSSALCVIVLGPTAPLPPEMVTKLEAYMNPKFGPGGKLMAFLPPVEQPGGKGFQACGLESLLEQFGIAASTDRIIVQLSPDLFFPMIRVKGSMNPEAEHPLAKTFAGAQGELPVSFVRPLDVIPRQGIVPVPLLETSKYKVWRENDMSAELTAIAKQLPDNPELQKAKGYADTIRTAVVVSQPVDESGRQQRPRLVCFGTDFFVDDASFRLAIRVGGGFRQLPRQVYFSRVQATIEWLREKPENIGIEPRPLGKFSFERTQVTNTMWQVPTAVMLLCIVGLGVGVWVVRRS